MHQSPNIDLEKPYADAAIREERYQEIKARAHKNIWEEFTDEQEAALFIKDWMADPDTLLRDIIQAVANRKTRGEKYTLDSIAMKIEEHVERVAEIKAQGIYEGDL